MEQLLESLELKAQLSAGDAVTLLRYIQEYASPIVSSRTSGTTVASDRPGSRGNCLQTKGNQKNRTHEKNKNTIEQKRFTSPVGTPKQSPLAEETQLSGGLVDLNNLEQFPPPVFNALPRKQEASRRNVRRITPTPVVSPPMVQEFSSPSAPWKSNPAFTSHSALSDTPIPINEERMLLREEQTHQKQRKGRSPRDANGSPWQQCSPVNCSESRSMKLEPRRLSDSKDLCHGQPRRLSDGKDLCHVQPRRLSDGKDVCHGQHGSPSVVSLDSPHRMVPLEASPHLHGSPHNSTTMCSPLTPSPRGAMKFPSQSPSSSYSGGILPSPGTPITPLQGYTQRGSQQNTSTFSSLSPSPCRADILSPSPCKAVGSDRTASFSGTVGSPWSAGSSPALLPIPVQWTASLSRISESEQKLLITLAGLYARLIIERMVPNPTTEIYFLVQILTTSATCVPARHDVLSGGTEGAAGLFTTVDSCIFFAVTALNKIRVYLSALDKSTLRLLSENARMIGLCPELAAFCLQLQESKSELAVSLTSRLDMGSAAVLFQEDTDNVKNFPNMKAFHAFKRQRDGFYAVMREWEKNHLNLDWNIQESLGDTIRGLVRQMPHGYSQTHFARLFQRQLLESCAQSSGLAAVSLDGCVPDHVKNVDFSKLLRLSGRFQQSSSGAGPCPPPMFNEMEGFFSEFIAIADSYIFNEHLKDSLSEELMKLHLKCDGLESKAVLDLLPKVRVLAKFLGYLVFLPYWSQFSGSQTRVNRSLSQALDVLQCVKEACSKGHLCLTIPWVVQYLSMMDSLALHSDYYKTLFHTLINIYRIMPLDTGAVCCSNMVVLYSLGWLFETPNVTEHVFFDYMKDMPGLLDLTSSLTQNKLDITEDVMYLCCPFLGEIRLLLAEFAAGVSRPVSVRKIKPVSADGDLTSADKLVKKLKDDPNLHTEELINAHNALTMQEEEKVQLIEVFFKSQQVFLKQLCELVSDRVAATAIAHMNSVILASHIGLGMKTLAQWLKNRLSCCSKDLDPTEVERALFQVTEQAVQSFSVSALTFYVSYCREQAKKALEPLLQWTVHIQVLTTANYISAMWAEEKCVKWLERQKANLQEEILKRFEKLRLLISTVQVAQSIDVAHGTQPCLPERPVLVHIQHGPFQLHKMVTDLQLSMADCGPSKAHLDQMCTHLRDAHNILVACAPAMGVFSSELLPNDSLQVLDWTIGVAICLVQFGCLGPPVSSETSTEADVLKCLIQLWKDFREFKMDVPLEKIMNATNFATYLSQQKKGYPVWSTLSRLLVQTIQSDISTTPVIEALWLCRRHQFSMVETAELWTAATVFLDMWYSHKEERQQEDSMFAEVHFIRLLCYVVLEQESDTIPLSVLSHSSICDIAHPF